MTSSPFKYDFAANDRVNVGFSYWLDGTTISRAFFDALPPKSADLIEVVLAAYTADRLSRRSFKDPLTGQRTFDIVVAVRDPDLWGDESVVDLLQAYLNWVSGDEWRFEFVRRRRGLSAAEAEPYLFHFPPRKPATVSLFSGGLDSLGGMAKHALHRSPSSCVLVSGYTHERLGSVQRRQVQRITAALEQSLLPKIPDIHHVAVPFGLRNPSNIREEPSQRTRAPVFLALGSTTAVQVEADTLWVYENGIGALNLPLNETQLGVDNYRGMHPRSLIMASQLFEKALGRKIHIENPCIFETKAEMCRHLNSTNLADIIADTVSCDSYPIRVPDQPQCGFCTSCILRRMSIHAANLGRYDLAHGYRHDILNSEPTLDQSQIYELSTTAYQAYKIKKFLASEDPWKSLTSEFPKLVVTLAELTFHKGLAHKAAVKGFLGLFRSYVSEWESFPANIKVASEEN